MHSVQVFVPKEELSLEVIKQYKVVRFWLLSIPDDVPWHSLCFKQKLISGLTLRSWWHQPEFHSHGACQKLREKTVFLWQSCLMRDTRLLGVIARVLCIAGMRVCKQEAWCPASLHLPPHTESRPDNYLCKDSRDCSLASQLGEFMLQSNPKHIFKLKLVRQEVMWDHSLADSMLCL